MAAVSEALNLGVKLGMDPKLMTSIFNTSSARCWSSDTYNPHPGVMENVPSSRDYAGGFGVDLIVKDLGLAIDAARAVHAPMPMTGLASQLYTMLSTNMGYGKRDFSVIYKMLRESQPNNK